MKVYRVEVIWNRTFNWSRFGPPCLTIEAAEKMAEDIKNSGDGARVKETRIIEEEVDLG